MESFVETVPDLVTLTGPVVASDGPRGTVTDGGYAALVCSELLSEQFGCLFLQWGLLHVRCQACPALVPENSG